MPDTNAVAVAATAAPATVSEAVGQHVEQGRAFVQQAMTWLTEHGIGFAVNLLVAILILVVGGFVVKGITAAVRASLRKSKRVNELLERFICSVVSKTGWAFLIVLALQRVGIDVGPLIAGLGVTGFIVGFACQDSLSNFANGIMIALNRPFKVGDYVIAGGVEGSVRELNMMAVVMTTPDNKLMTVPNKAVWGSAITNFSALETRRVDVAVGIAYGADIGQAKQVALDALAQIPEIIAEPAPMTEVSSLGESAVVLTVRGWCKNADYWTAYFAATRKVKEAFAAKGVHIPFPQLDVHVHNA
jgi:small conductance mechanosensitive channel